jgi:hypothetical protein
VALLCRIATASPNLPGAVRLPSARGRARRDVRRGRRAADIGARERLALPPTSRFAEGRGAEDRVGTATKRQVARVALYTEGEIAEVARYDATIDWFMRTGDCLRSALE